MLLIRCPYCGYREETEFSYHGQAHIVRPLNPESLSDEEWGDYVFFRDNPRGPHVERWMHAAGCRQFFNMERDTQTGEIHRVYLPGAGDATNDTSPDSNVVDTPPMTEEKTTPQADRQSIKGESPTPAEEGAD